MSRPTAKELFQHVRRTFSKAEWEIICGNTSFQEKALGVCSLHDVQKAIDYGFELLKAHKKETEEKLSQKKSPDKQA